MVDVPALFIVDADDSALAVYIEPNVEDKIQLVRDMKARGANIVKSIRDAKVILVSSTQPDQAQEIYKEWGQQAPVVDCVWARRAIAAGEADAIEKYLVSSAMIKEWLGEEGDFAFEEEAPMQPPSGHTTQAGSSQTVVDRPLASSLSPSPPPATAGGIFKDQNRRYTFFIQLDIKNRIQLSRIVKRQRGMLIASIADADYIILSRNSNGYEQLVASIPAGKSAIRPAFIEDCDTANRLLRWQPYVEAEGPQSAPATPRKRTHSQTTTSDTPRSDKKGSSTQTTFKTSKLPQPASSRASRVSLPVSAPASTSRLSTQQTRTLRQPLKQSAASLLSSSRTTRPAGTRSPTPPSEVVKNRGGHAFTDADRHFATECHRVILLRDPAASRSRIAAYIQKKAPHHSINSWNNYIHRKIPDLYDQLRKQATARAAGLSSSSTLQSKANLQTSAPATTPARLGTSRIGGDLDLRLQRIAIYLVDAQAKNITAVAALSSLDRSDSKCDVAPSWLEFYQRNLVEIDRRMQDRVTSASRSDTPSKAGQDSPRPVKRQRTSSADTVVADV